MAHTSPSLHRAALLASTVAALTLLTGCGNGTSATPQQAPATAAPAAGGTKTSAAADRSSPPSGGAAPAATPAGSASSAGTGSAVTGTRCHTLELKASVGRNDPGAGQENFPVVLTNTSGRTCTLRGYPGAAFVDASGKQLGPDPKRSTGTPTTVTLKPGRSAWAGLTFSNPEVSGAKTATPAALIVTPPDERTHLTVTWTGGKVPVGGNASSVFLTVFSPGTGP